MTTDRGYGFRVRELKLAPRNDDSDVTDRKPYQNIRTAT